MIYEHLTIKYHSINFFFQAEDGIRDYKVTGVQTCALPIFHRRRPAVASRTHGQQAVVHGLPPGNVGADDLPTHQAVSRITSIRSEERRVGKERRLRRSAVHEKKKRARNTRTNTLDETTIPP